MNHRVEPCPDLETIAAFLDARLAEGERERIAAHCAACERCYFLVSEAAHAGSASAAERSFVRGVRRVISRWTRWWRRSGSNGCR